MREILFKGKCIDETCLKGQWLEGQILHDGVTGKYYIHRDNCLNESDNVGEEGLLRVVAYEVDSETVCQYTGLTDKNGKKIFEGDVVAFTDMYSIETGYAEGDCVGKVVWDAKEVCFYVTERLLAESWEVLQDCYVAGNIFDNPELIEKNV